MMLSHAAKLTLMAMITQHHQSSKSSVWDRFKLPRTRIMIGEPWITTPSMMIGIYCQGSLCIIKAAEKLQS